MSTVETVNGRPFVPVVLQRQITLDEALLEGLRTYRNGCNFRLLACWNGQRREYKLEFGCYCLVNLEQGAGALLIGWLGGKDAKAPRALHGVHPRTIYELLKRPPCACCGGTRFWERP